jgi:hypothetical protein
VAGQRLKAVRNLPRVAAGDRIRHTEREDNPAANTRAVVVVVAAAAAAHQGGNLGAEAGRNGLWKDGLSSRGTRHPVQIGCDLDAATAIAGDHWSFVSEQYCQKLRWNSMPWKLATNGIIWFVGKYLRGNRPCRFWASNYPMASGAAIITHRFLLGSRLPRGCAGHDGASSGRWV